MTEKQIILFTDQIYGRIQRMQSDRERRAYLVRLLWHEKYVWGGESVTGADCSGSISYAGYLLGYNIRVTADNYDKMFTEDLDSGIPIAGDVCIWYHPNEIRAKHIAMFSDHLMIMDADRRFLDTPVSLEIMDRPNQRFRFKRLNLHTMREASHRGKHAYGIDDDVKELFEMFKVDIW